MQIFFFLCRITFVLESCWSSQGWWGVCNPCTLPLWGRYSPNPICGSQTNYTLFQSKMVKIYTPTLKNQSFPKFSEQMKGKANPTERNFAMSSLKHNLKKSSAILILSQLMFEIIDTKLITNIYLSINITMPHQPEALFVGKHVLHNHGVRVNCCNIPQFLSPPLPLLYFFALAQLFLWPRSGSYTNLQ